MMRKSLVLFHPSADLYGADKILINTIDALYDTYRIILVIPVNGVLVDELRRKFPDVELHIEPSMPVIARKYATAKGLVRFAINKFRFRKFISRLKIDKESIICCNTLASSACLSFFPKNKRISHIHEILPNNRFIHKCLNKYMLRRSSFVIAVSDAVKKNLEQCNTLGRPITTVHNGLIRQNPLKSRPQVVTFSLVGRLKPSIKGQNVVIEAVDILRHKTDVPFRVYFWGSTVSGQEYMRDEIQNYINLKDLRSYITIKDFTKDINEIYIETSVTIVPSIYPDSLPTTAIESLSFGIPVIGSDIGGIPEIIEHNNCGFIIPPNDPNSLANAMLEYIQDNSIIKTQGSEALTRFEKCFSEESFKNKIKTLI